MPEPSDPRDIVTPYAFRVAPEILGLPLAGPFRRGAAIFVDLLGLAALLLVKEISATLLGFVIAWILFKVSSPRAQEGVTGPVARPVVRASAYAALAVSGLALGTCFLGFVGDDGPTSPRERVAREAREGPRGGALGVRETIGMVGAVAQITSASDSAAAQEPADRFAIALARSGVGRSEREEAVRELLRAEEAPWRRDVARVALARANSAATAMEAGADGDTLPEQAGVEGRDTAASETAARDTSMGALPPAGLATGLLGFLEIFWDANRQGVHDRIAGTVVVRTRDGHVTLDRARVGQPAETAVERPSGTHPQNFRTG